MTFQITGKNLDVGDALKSYVTEKLEQSMEKYVGAPLSVHVFIEKERGAFNTDCSIQLRSGLLLQSHGSSSDAYASVDEAAERLEKRLRRYKRRLKKHNSGHDRKKAGNINAIDYMIKPEQDEVEDQSNEEDAPVIVAETQLDVHELSVSDAVMELDVANQSFLVFRNAKHGNINIVYKRPDGHIGWIDPADNQKAAE
ncbi:MAG: ribosome hibernation-promoting factor, HPF/YfiA family [Methyloligellaceae bacterium]